MSWSQQAFSGVLYYSGALFFFGGGYLFQSYFFYTIFCFIQDVPYVFECRGLPTRCSGTLYYVMSNQVTNIILLSWSRHVSLSRRVSWVSYLMYYTRYLLIHMFCMYYCCCWIFFSIQSKALVSLYGSFVFFWLRYQFLFMSTPPTEPLSYKLYMLL